MKKTTAKKSRSKPPLKTTSLSELKYFVIVRDPVTKETIESNLFRSEEDAFAYHDEKSKTHKGEVVVLHANSLDEAMLVFSEYDTENKK
jgi:hypothetical protein